MLRFGLGDGEVCCAGLGWADFVVRLTAVLGRRRRREIRIGRSTGIGIYRDAKRAASG